MYDNALSEAVIDSLEFDYNEGRQVVLCSVRVTGHALFCLN